MSTVGVTLYGAVPEKIGDKEIVSLTGSASILNIFGNKVLIDIGLFQGGEGSDLYNKENTKFINDLDAVFITHSHIDHIGRLPLLHKLGFRGPIYMTKATKEITYEMLLDCLKIQEGDSIIREKKSKTLVNRLEKSLKFKNELLAEFKKKRKLDESKQNDLNELDEYLNFYDVKNDSDIEKVLISLKQTLFNNDDINGVISLIKTVDNNEEILFDYKKISTHNNNREDQDLLNNLPREIVQGNNQKIEVDKDSEARKLKKRWLLNLLNEVKDLLIDKDLKYRDINKNLLKKLQEAYTFCMNEYPAYNNGKLGIHKNHIDEYENSYKEYTKLLNFYGIEKRENIDELYERNKKFIDLLNNKSSQEILDLGFNENINNGIDNTLDILSKILEIFNLKTTFNVDNIYKAYNNLIVLNQKSKNRNNISINFSEAAHLVGSSSVTFTINLVNKKVDNILNIGKESISVFFSGDMGRIKDNRLGRPELPPKTVNYLQIESTYGGRNHRNRQESVNELIDSIEKSQGNVLISVFSQQRLQEILLTIFEEKEKRGEGFLDYDILVDAPLGEKVTDKYIKFRGDIYEPLKKGFYKFLGENEWQFIYMDSEEQFIDTENTNKKSIILASSGMMDGGAIINHLPHILADEKATLLAPGYLSKGTLGNEIIWGDKKFVTIDGTKCEIKCNKKYIDGFSSHIGHEEIIQYIKETLEISKLQYGATIALTHGNREGQLLLKEEIEEILNSDKYKHLSIKVTIPGIFEEYNIMERRVDKKNISENILNDRRDILLEKVVYKKPIIPRLLKESEEKIEKIEQEKIPQVITEEKNRNKKDIIQIKLLGDIISKRRKVFNEEHLNRLFNIFKDDYYLLKVEENISKLSSIQRKEFYEKIDEKITKNDTIDKNISNLGKKNTQLLYIKNDLIKFFKSIKIEKFCNIAGLKETLNKLEQEKIELKSKIYDLENYKGEKDKDSIQKIKDLRNNLKSKDKKTKHLENEIKNYKNEILNIQNDLYRVMKGLFSDENVGEFKNIFNNLVVDYSEELEEDINILCKKNILENNSKIEDLQKEKTNHIEIKFRKSISNFGGKDLYNELYDISKKEIDLEKLQKLINNVFFNTQDLLYINSKLAILKSSDGEKRKKIGAMNDLVSFFKQKRNENKDKGIDATFYIDDLNKICLQLLSKIFIKDEFDNEIKNKFDIYLFLHSKLSFKDYILKKLNIKKLEGLDHYLEIFDNKEKLIDELISSIEILEEKSDTSNSLKELKDLNFLISITRSEVNDILDLKK